MSVRTVVRVFSELCLTVGTVIVLFVVYVLFWTGVRADSATAGQLDRLREQWAKSAPASKAPDPKAPDSKTPATPAPEEPAPAYREGEPFAVMYVPRFGEDWDWPVLEGTATGTLKKGLGHYRATARLGEHGNFSVAGHRRTYGDPFKDFPKLRPGDPVYVRDGTTWFTYRIVNRPHRTVPSDIGVVDPVPRGSGFDGPGRYLTLTTCDPEWGSSHRLIAWAHLDGEKPVAEGEPTGLRR
ncbi:class E sortase [Streptomyces sp. NPDC050504]|uniref:class E sortase n=1 Tax=Streptomyces sp. NPDC050504 TaxID=3365618 RepID=UPI0037A03E30